MGIDADDRRASLVGRNPPEIRVRNSGHAVRLVVSDHRNVVLERHTEPRGPAAYLAADAGAVPVESPVAAHEQVGVRQIGVQAGFHAPDRAFRIQIEHFGGTGVRAEIGIALIGPVEMIPENDVVEAVLADRVAQPGHVVLEILAFQPEAQFDPPCIAPLERADAPHVIGKRVERHPNRRDEVRGITPRRMIRKAEHAIASPDRAPHVLLVFSRCVSATGRMGVKVRFLHSGRQVGRSAFPQRRQN